MTATLRPGFLLPLIAAALLPTSGWAHATDFILVKVSPHAGRVDVELTADYGGNPMFTDKAEAQAVLTHVLRLRTGDGSSSSELAALAPLRFEDRRQFDPTAPIPLDPTTGAETHQLLTAVWSWNCGAQKIAFEMPSDSNQSVILWTPPPSQGGSIQAGGGGPEEKPRWVFLLPGEVSPEMVVPPRSATAWLVSCVSAGLLGISATIGFSLAARRRRSAGA
jgi:hypothetical protein